MTAVAVPGMVVVMVAVAVAIVTITGMISWTRS